MYWIGLPADIAPNYGYAVRVKTTSDQGPVRYVIDERLDFNHFGPLRKSYIVASSYRSGSQYLCWRLWQTGLLGAPSEILNPTSELRVLTNRLKAHSPADYIAKLLARRTSRNGVFGIKAHFHHFEAFLKEYPALLELLSPTTYIYITRDDKIAQAVSMAKALQTDAWTSRMEDGSKPVLIYNPQMIAHCLADIEQQDLAWRQWFESQNITPFIVTYDKLTSNTAGVIRSIIELLGVQNDEPEEVHVPPARKQGDETNQDWIERFQRETGADKKRDRTESTYVCSGERSGSGQQPVGRHLFDRYGQLIGRIPAGGASISGFLDEIRLRRQHDVIVGSNPNMFSNTRVLDIMSSQWFWSLAALDAGATHVMGVDASSTVVEAAASTFSECNLDPQAYRFVKSEIFALLRSLKPQAFDVIICHGFFEQCDVRRFFRHLKRLCPKRIILDTGIAVGEGPIIRFTLDMDLGLEMNRILAVPNHALIMFLCEAFGFRWRLIDWRTMGINDWTGIHDYERDQRRTYVLDRPNG
jgi:trehalose 2-sulfotransferase